MTQKIEKAHANIEGTRIARAIIEFQREFRDVYGEDTLTSSLCAVGPLQSLVGHAIAKGIFPDIASAPMSELPVSVKALTWQHDGSRYHAYCRVTDTRYVANNEGEKREREAVRAARILSALVATPPTPSAEAPRLLTCQCAKSITDPCIVCGKGKTLVTVEWLTKMAAREGDLEIGVGRPVANVGAAEAPERGIEAYDAGLLSDYGGGDVGWWQDYIRAELARAHDFYAHQIESALSPVLASGEDNGTRIKYDPEISEILKRHVDDTASALSTKEGRG